MVDRPKEEAVRAAPNVLGNVSLNGAMSVIKVAVTKGVPESSWLGRMLIRKPRMVVAIALANKMARMIWAMLTKGEDYRDPMAETVA